MEPVTIPISICPHSSQGKLRGHYLLAKRLFLNDQPILVRRQYVGFNGFLFVTVVHPNKWNTIFKMSCAILEMDQQPIKWLGTVHQYSLPGGFKVYLPEHILKAGLKAWASSGNIKPQGLAVIILRFLNLLRRFCLVRRS